MFWKIRVGSNFQIQNCSTGVQSYPLIVGEELLGAIFLFHPDVGHFSEDELDLVQAAANQIAVAINNAELYNLISEQAEELSVLLRQQKVETSQSRAILEAVAEGVLVTDASSFVMLFNDSAGKIWTFVGSSSRQLDRSSDGLFGRVGYKWIETIQHWHKNQQVPVQEFVTWSRSALIMVMLFL